MTVRLSREPGRFSVVLHDAAWVDAEQFAAPLASALSLPRSDTVRMCRLQRGILLEGATQEQAQAAADVLAGGGVQATAVADEAMPLLPKAVHVAIVSLEPAGFMTPSLQGAGMPQIWSWDDLRLVCAGILVGPQAQASSLVDKVAETSMDDPQDRRSMAARALEKARMRVFPLRGEITEPEPEPALALGEALRGSGASREVPGFGVIGTVIDMVFTDPFERLRVTEKSRATSLQRSSSRARDAHMAVAEIARVAPRATLPQAAGLFARGVDAGDYVFDDMSQFEAHCRWAWFRHLKGKSATA